MKKKLEKISVSHEEHPKSLDIHSEDEIFLDPRNDNSAKRIFSRPEDISNNIVFSFESFHEDGDSYVFDYDQFFEDDLYRFMEDDFKSALPTESSNSENGLVGQCSLDSRFPNVSKFIAYLNRVVLYGHFKKLSKVHKIVIFNQVSNYLQQFYPNLINSLFKPLSRNEKRSVPLVDQRLFDIKDYIYELFESDKKTEILIPIKKQICNHISYKHKKKNKKFSDEELDCIKKWESGQINFD